MIQCAPGAPGDGVIGVEAPEGISEDLWKGVRDARLWSGASDEALAWMARTARLSECAKGDTLFREGEVPSDIAVILAGHARALYDRDGRTLSIETYWPGDVVGAIAALANIGFDNDIEAAESMSVALIPVGAVRDLLSSEPAVAMSVIDDLARRWLAAIALAKRGSLGVPQRIAGYLSELPRTKLGADAYSVEIPVSRIELAALLGTTPETLSRAFHLLEDAELIEAHDRMVIVPSGKALLHYGHADAAVPTGRPAE
jgi:CRP/FNR family transcriptional regulator, dissimilatory nitrate respiration regulator